MALNSRLLRIAVSKQAEPVLAREVKELMKVDFESKKEAFLEEFDAHPVTQELEEGPHAFSRVPELANQGGNLFSFLGFFRGERPAAELRDYLEKSIKIKLPRKGQLKGKKIIYTATVEFPTVQDVDQAMAKKVPLDWVTRPFTQLISKGIPGLPNYLFRENPPFGSPEPSRSGTAIQVKKKIRGGSFRGIPYIGELLGDLKRRFANSRSRR